MKDEYVLYLDESEFKASKTFAIAGIAVKKENIDMLEMRVNEIKKLIWDDKYISENNPVLHCTELQKIFTKRKMNNISGVKEEYQEFIKKSDDEIEKIYYQVYGRIAQLLKKAQVTVFSCIIKIQQLNDLFFLDKGHNGIHLIDDKYNIALQKIIESYTHYLSANDGYGDVVYEARNSTGENSAKSPDIKLTNVYHKIQANNKGIVYTDSKVVQSRNRTIVILSKNDNLAGLQLADFVAYNIIKLENCKVEQQKTDFMKLIHRLSYNGGHLIEDKDQRSFWGMMVLPSYLRMGELLVTNKTLKNSYNNLKKEKNRLKKLNDSNSDRILQLQETVDALNNRNKELENYIKNIDTSNNKSYIISDDFISCQCNFLVFAYSMWQMV